MDILKQSKIDSTSCYYEKDGVKTADKETVWVSFEENGREYNYVINRKPKGINHMVHTIRVSSKEIGGSRWSRTSSQRGYKSEAKFDRAIERIQKRFDKAQK